MSDQQVDAVLTATEPEPRTRIRVNHSRTIKEGWGYETTVEIEFRRDEIENDAGAIARLGALMEAARVVAVEERDARNAQDGKP